MNFIFPAQPDQTIEQYARSVDPETLARRYGLALDSLCDLERDLQRYHDALVAIRDNSSDLAAIALANNVLMGLQCDFGFIVYPARPKLQ